MSNEVGNSSPVVEKSLQKLPIGGDETVLAVYRHHWFVYVASILTGLIFILVIIAITLEIGHLNGGFGFWRNQTLLEAALAFSGVILIGTAVPVYLHSRQKVVLTDRSVVLVFRPGPFAWKNNRLSLFTVNNVSSERGFLGAMFGFGTLVIESNSVQIPYKFPYLARPQEVVGTIVAERDEYLESLEAGKLYAPSPPVPNQ